MAYDEALAQRIRAVLPAIPGFIEKKMFGGLAFMLNGNMACAVSKDNLMLRISPEAMAAALAKPGVRMSEMSGRPMKGWLLVEPAAMRADSDLERWVSQGIAFAQPLPPK